MVKRIIAFIFCCSTVFTACSQSDSVESFVPVIRHHTIPVGETTVLLRQYSFEAATPFTLVHLHSNETTAGTAAEEFARKWGIYFLQLQNGVSRLVTFLHQRKQYQFDPNRIFSEEGIRKTLTLTSQYTKPAQEAVKRFSDSLLQLFQPEKPVVAIHNNTDGKFNILQYSNASIGQVHLNPLHDEDDFFITNDKDLFELLKEADYNVVWEDATQLEEDGSLSLYCSRNIIRYINIEAEHGHLQQQTAMLEVVRQILK